MNISEIFAQLTLNNNQSIKI